MYGAKYKKLHYDKLQLHIWRVIEGEGDEILVFALHVKIGTSYFCIRLQL